MAWRIGVWPAAITLGTSTDIISTIGIWCKLGVISTTSSSSSCQIRSRALCRSHALHWKLSVRLQQWASARTGERMWTVSFWGKRLKTLRSTTGRDCLTLRSLWVKLREALHEFWDTRSAHGFDEDTSSGLKQFQDLPLFHLSDGQYLWLLAIDRRWSWNCSIRSTYNNSYWGINDSCSSVVA